MLEYYRQTDGILASDIIETSGVWKILCQILLQGQDGYRYQVDKGETILKTEEVSLEAIE